MKRFFVNSFSLLNFCALLMGLMGLMVIINVILRYFFGISYVWADDLVTLLFAFTTFFGAIVAVKNEGHIRIDFLLKKLPEKIQQPFVNIFFMHTLIIIVQIQIIRSSIKWIRIAGNTVPPGLRIPNIYRYILLPISALLIIFYSLGSIYNYFKTKHLIKK